MVLQAPKIDQRSATQIVAQVEQLLKVYVPELDASGEVAAALVNIFGRFAELIIERLNQVPQKNFLAFLDLLGASLLPPQPARAPLTFLLAAGSAVDGVVPPETQVAAAPAEGEKDPVLFETERELTVTAAQMSSVFARNPLQDKYADLSSVINATARPGIPIFQGNRPLEHILYFGHDLLLSFSRIENLRAAFTVEQILGDEGEFQWQVWNGSDWIDLSDSSAPLIQPGETEINFGSVEPVPPSEVNSISNRWLRCRLKTPITRSNSIDLVSGMVREAQLPELSQVRIGAHLLRPLDEGLLPEIAFTNSAPVDFGKDFFPFGEKPKLGDALYLGNNESFSKDAAQGLAARGATISLLAKVVNSHLFPGGTSVRPSEDVELAWECWNGAAWERVGTSTAPPWMSLIELDPVPPLIFGPLTGIAMLFQGTAQKGATVTANVPAESAVTVGEDGRFAIKPTLFLDVNVITFTVTYKGQTRKAWAVTYMETGERTQNIQLSIDSPSFVKSGINTVNLKVIVSGPAKSTVKALRVTTGVGSVVEALVANPLVVPLVDGRNELLIEGLDSLGGRRLAATTYTISREAAKPAPNPTTGFSDGTFAFCQDGIVTLRLPNSVSMTAVNGQESYWLRVRLVKGDYGREATYKLKDPTNPAEGFTLILSTFRPPIVSETKIGYEHDLIGPAETCLAYNNLEFDDLTLTNKAGGQSFRPFRPAPENRPAIYVGFTLPRDRKTFPNRKISLFGHASDFRYNEKYIPLSPLTTESSGATEEIIIHKFLITNPASEPADFEMGLFGMRWPTEMGVQTRTLAPGESQEVQVRVTIPIAEPGGSSDQGYLRVTTSADPDFEHSAAFITRVDQPLSGNRPQLSWQYWNGTTWSKLVVRDESENFTRSGPIEFLAPSDLAIRTEFGLNRYWVRATWESGRYLLDPVLHRFLLNTTMAAQVVTVKNEILGSGDGSKGQVMRASRAPVLVGQRLEVREMEMPPSNEQEKIREQEGEDAIRIVTDEAGRPQEIWVRWSEVPDFYASGGRDRHYVIDHLTGAVHFGDGQNGMIPPVGSGNIRLVNYKTGGGSKGNKPADTITQLKTTVPYVEKVNNHLAATGGANAESLESLFERSPRLIRHRNRAVTSEDFEDLAILASPAVARAKCVPLFNLAIDPAGEQSLPGTASLIIVPHSTDARPMPGLELIKKVKEYVEARKNPAADLFIVGPQYIRVSVNAEIALVSMEGASEMEQAVTLALSRFLHPLTGGLDGRGWNFGRKPYKSDLYALIESIPGVDHLRALDVIETTESEGTGDRFLVYSGTHEITLTVEET